jgi:gliding motility-associated-like protein
MKLKIRLLFITVLAFKLSISQVPIISNVVPFKALIGDTIVLTGSNFGSSNGSNLVYFGSVKGQVITSNATQLSVIVPHGAIHSHISVTVANKTGYWKSHFFPVYNRCTDSIISSHLSSPVAFNTGSNPQNIAVADIDGDGKNDLLLGNMSSNTLSVLRNTAILGSINTSSFATKADFNTSASARLISIADFDGDGKLDVAVPTYNGIMLNVFRNTSSVGAISFASKLDLNLPGEGFNSAVGDFNGDGKPEIAVVSLTTGYVSVFPNNSTVGSLNFGTRIDLNNGTSPTSVDIGDIDGDNKPDLCVSYAATNNLVVYKNNYTTGILSSSAFASPVNLSITNPVCVKIFDVDGDGKNDIGVTNVPGTNRFSVFRNVTTVGVINGSSFASAIHIIVGGGTPQFFSIGDFNGDGKPDIVTPNSSSNNLSLLKNNSSVGNIIFSESILASTGALPTGSVIADIDGDDRPDIAICSQNSNVATVFRNIPPSLGSVYAGADTSICMGASAQLHGSGGGPYEWQPAILLDNPVTANPIASPINTTSFIVKGSGSLCPGYDTVIVSVKTNSILLDAGSLISICFGDTVQLQATSGALNYKWTPSYSLSDTAIYNPLAHPIVTTQYTVTAVDPLSGCTLSDTVSVVVNMTGGRKIFNNDTSICPGSSVQLFATGGNIFQWKPSGTLNNPNVSNPIATPLDTTVYIVQVSTSGSCISSDTVIVNVLAAPDVLLKDTSVCENAEIILFPLTTAPGWLYSWNTGATTSSIKIKAVANKDYWVKASNGICYGAADTAKVTILPTPVSSFDIAPTIGDAPLLIQTHNTTLGANSYYWFFGDKLGVIGRAFDTSYLYKDTGNYVLKLVAVNSNGCTDTSFKFIKVVDSVYVFIPTAFSPNEDGNNDTWEVQFNGVTSYEVLIFNRWGELVFKQDQTSGTDVVKWDGKFRDKDVSDGVYFYIIRYLSYKKKGRVEKAGPIVIFR